MTKNIMIITLNYENTDNVKTTINLLLESQPAEG